MQKTHDVGLDVLGKTLNLVSSTPAREWPRNIMLSFISHWVCFFRPTLVATPSSPAAALMESADRSAGVDAHHAQELRAAASAWLSVVR